MANVFERFNKLVVGTSTSYADYTSRISSRGDFTRLEGLQSILNSWNNILLTPLRTVDHDPDYGCELYKYVFAPQDNKTLEGIKREIYERLFYYDDRAEIKKVDVKFLKDRRGFVINIYINYKGQEDNLQVFIDENKYFNAIQS
jgi:phage baseplate assembly protein W